LILLLSSVDDGEKVALAENQMLDAIDLELGSRELRVEDGVTDLHVHRETVTVIVERARPYGHDLARLRLLFGGVGNDET
jgi:hypothetical protein